MQVLERLQHRVLRRVFGFLSVSQYAEDQKVDGPMVGVNEVVEEITFASENTRDKFLVTGYGRTRFARVSDGCPNQWVLFPAR
ncbi:MAG: hypothetical protein WCC92_03780 [Candidatus Korobacteraceae bacterium]